MQDSNLIEKYAIFCISQLNNFLRAYLISINGKAYMKNRVIVQYPAQYQYANLVDEFIRVGNPRKYKRNKIGQWGHIDEPAYHNPRVFLNIINAINPSNIGDIHYALTDSWKIDVLRSVRNYFAHRCHGTEIEAVANVKLKYTVSAKRADKILMENDPTIARKVIEDINEYIISFATNIT